MSDGTRTHAQVESLSTTHDVVTRVARTVGIVDAIGFSLVLVDEHVLEQYWTSNVTSATVRLTPHSYVLDAVAAHPNIASPVFLFLKVRNDIC